jgi:hypothetical protein
MLSAHIAAAEKAMQKLQFCCHDGCAHTHVTTHFGHIQHT